MQDSHVPGRSNEELWIAGRGRQAPAVLCAQGSSAGSPMGRERPPGHAHSRRDRAAGGDYFITTIRLNDLYPPAESS